MISRISGFITGLQSSSLGLRFCVFCGAAQMRKVKDSMDLLRFAVLRVLQGSANAQSENFDGFIMFCKFTVAFF